MSLHEFVRLVTMEFTQFNCEDSEPEAHVRQLKFPN